MKTSQERALAASNGGKFKGWIVGGTALLSSAAGSLLTARLMHLNQASANSNRVFELMIYHTVPGKVPALESIFRVSQLQAKHDLDVVGYWVPNDDPAWKDNIHLCGGSSQPRQCENELAGASCRPGISTV